MTYDEICAALEVRDCTSTLRALDYAVREEACALLDGFSRYGSYKNVRHQQLRIPSDKATEAAKELYAEDITNLLREYEDPTPARMLDHRRFSVAWAVSEVLRTHNKNPMKCCVKCGSVIGKPRLLCHQNERCVKCGD